MTLTANSIFRGFYHSIISTNAGILLMVITLNLTKIQKTSVEKSIHKIFRIDPRDTMVKNKIITSMA